MHERSIFMAAVAMETPAQRSAYLDEACAGDAALRRRVEALLASHEQASSFLGKTVPEGLAERLEATRGEPPAAEEAPTSAGDATGSGSADEGQVSRVGPYKLLQEIGAGGMGTVWMAEQTEPIRRRVAVKVVKEGMDSAQVLARFEAERQALALMDHPNIARVLDAGRTPAGRPYFVMELVKGQPITRYCDEQRLGVRERLELFAGVCRAVQHAHQKGVIHRDLKPSNVLVAPYDGVPVVKVIDFGVAKATGQQLTERTLFTGFGALVGTPEYMSPEQAEVNNQDVDTRSDVYALGVLLYELLTGSTPLTRKRAREEALLEVLRAVREEEPPRPSTRLSDSKELPSIAAQRGAEPARLTKLVCGELDWIVMKALEKDRSRRYETSSALAADVERYLGDEPVLACPPSAWYRFGKLVRRHRGPVVAAAVFVLLLAAGAMGSTLGLVRALDAEQKTRTALEAETAAKQQLRQAMDALTDDVVETMFARQPELAEQEKDFLSKVLALYESATRQLEEMAETRLLRARGFYKVAFLRNLLGQQREAKADYRQAILLLGQLADELPGVSEYRQRLASADNNLGIVLAELGENGEAEQALREAVALREKLATDSPGERSFRRELAAGWNDLASALQTQGRLDAAEKAYHRSLEVQERLAAAADALPADRQGLARTRSNLGQVLRKQKRNAEAEKLYRLALPVQQQNAEAFPNMARLCRELADSHGGLGIVLAEMGKDGEAEASFQKSRELRNKIADLYPNVFSYQHELAKGYDDLGYFMLRRRKTAEAEQAYGQAVQLRKKLVAKSGGAARQRQELAACYDRLGQLRRHTGRPDEAVSTWKEALTLRRRLAAEFPESADYHNELAGSLGKLAAMHLQRREVSTALVMLEEALPQGRAALAAAPGNPLYREFHRNNLMALAECHRQEADHARLATTAEELARFAPDSATDPYLAACILCTSVNLAAGDMQLSEPRRKELARGYADKAVTFLREAVARGYKDIDALKNNTDLEPLRQNEQFLQMLSQLEGKGKGESRGRDQK
jgi:serine/threonine protein kinase/tetratricopeptide (TPR) repeat protein